MTKYILKRLVVSVLTLLCITTASFFLLRLLPGNPFGSLRGMDPQMQERMIHYYGLDRPLFEQYLSYLGNLIHGDLGYSLKYTGKTVNEIIAQTFPYSMQLGLQAYFVSFPLGIFWGVIASLHRGKALDYGVVVFSALGTAVPVFIIGTVFQYFFAIKLKILPTAQWNSLAHTILPTVTLAIGATASKTKSMRTLMLEVMEEDYIQTARSKGIPKWKVIWNHQIRNAILPIVSTTGNEIAAILMGSFVVEQIFAIPGLGAYYVTSIQNLDYTMTLGLTIFFSIFVITFNFAVDLLYGLIDPRIRIAEDKGDRHDKYFTARF